jgi:GT2 family glycosyltransferase
VDTRAPAVVAVVVTTGSGPGLEATIASLVAQDYENLSVLVMANGDPIDVVDRVAIVAPQTFVKVQETNLGFAAACNEAASMVSGATFMVFCHDDVRLQPSCVSQMVEAAFRQNAGIVTPKIVDYDDPMILVHVGQVADRFGSVRERIEIGEIDHGQQDLERDVFVAPGGVTLVRADLFAALRGFDPLIPALGEDLNFCWRAQIAGARIVVAPQAVAAHRQSLARGEREVQAATTRGRSRQDLQRRHQLWTVLSCWGMRDLLLTLALWWVLDVVELVVALISRDTDRFGAIMGSWRFAWRHRAQLRTRRHEIEATRVLDDDDIRRLQVGGSSRVRRFVENLVYDGIDRAIGVLPPHDAEIDLSGDSAVGFGASFSEDESFDEVG